MNVLTLGFFDGVHIGHAALLNRAADLSARLGLTSCALTFDIQPGRLTKNDRSPLINTLADREFLLKKYVKRIITLRFDEKMMNMNPLDFISDIIAPNAAHVVVGFDCRFGRGGLGTPELLAKECKRLNIGCDIIPPVTLDGAKVSSTLIRELIANGKTEEAVRHLGHPHILSGLVSHGKGLGSAIGAPTVNIELPDDIVKPLFGVYLTQIFAKGKMWQSVTNVGVRPTVSQNGRPNAETTIFGFSGDLYDTEIRLEFLQFLRSEKQFNSIDELAGQIAADIDEAKRLHFSNNR